MSIGRRQFLLSTAMLSAGGLMKLTPLQKFLGINEQTVSSAGGTRKNVLFIPVDDLRPQLGCYGSIQMKSPNIDKLATQGVVFDKAYCQQPICMATRASLLSGYRPDHADIYSCKSVKELMPDALTLNKHFENNGYRIWATGKIYHYPEDHKIQFGSNYVQAKGKWSGNGYLAKESIEMLDKNKGPNDSTDDDNLSSGRKGKGPAYECVDVPDNAYADGLQAELAIAQLEKFSKANEPFFMAVGFRKPHLPFCAPKKYWDMYKPEDIHLANNPFLPKNANMYTKYNFDELRNYYGIPQGESPIPDDLARNLIHGYYASVSYTDAQIGKLLDALDRLNLRENTVIVLWGDHGWKLGEHGMWCKHTPFELDAHVPFMISAPGEFKAGARVQSMAEYVDIYPTLCELCGLELPAHLEGNSLLPAMRSPSTEIKTAAFTQWPKVQRLDREKVITAYSIRTGQYRYIEWTHNKSGKVMAAELYDHQTDPDENENIAEVPAHREMAEKLHAMLDGGKGWKNFRPKK